MSAQNEDRRPAANRTPTEPPGDTNNAKSTPLEHALWAASLGGLVFPLKAGGKAPQAGGHGFKDATSDPAQIHAWAAQLPGCNWGLVNGTLFDVIDLDGDLGRASVLEFYGGTLPPVLAWAKSPNGLHGYIPVTGRPRKPRALPKVDLLGAGGYVVLVGSVVDGRRYEWLTPPPVPGAPVDASRWLELWDLDTPRAAPAAPLVPALAPADGDAYAKAALDGIRAELAEAVAWPEGHTDAHGRGWEKLSADAAFKVARLAITPGSGVTLDTGLQVLAGLVPEPIALAVSVPEKWRSQSARAVQAGPVVVIPRGPEAFGLNVPNVAPLGAPGAPVASSGGGYAGLEPVDLAQFADGTHKPEPATLLRRSDGAGLLYPGKTHALNGEPESGKSMVAQWVVAVELTSGHDVLVFDYESDPGTYCERLAAMGAPAEAIRRHLVYVNPEADPSTSPATAAALDALVASRTFALAVLDGVTEALALMGGSSNSGDDVTRWGRFLPRRIADAGPAVVMVDHVVKDREGRGRFAIGSQAKLAAISGAAYLVDVRRPLGRGVVGEVSLKVAKDRPGYVRGIAAGWNKSTRLQEAARVIIDGTMPGRISVGITPPPLGERDDDGAWRPTNLMEKVSRALEDVAAAPSFNKLVELLGSNRDHVQAAVAALVKEGYVTTAPGPRNSTLHTSVKPYREATDARLAMTGGAIASTGARDQSVSELGTMTGPPIGGETGDQSLSGPPRPVETSRDQRPVPHSTGGPTAPPAGSASLGWAPPMPMQAAAAVARERKS
ncbi:MAG TPA: bifunctional DNA primase/polymerase [Arachnia sp.]|nr:bifunctional DNA primase/polymerase [Arachnia sp.]HMT87171.1 bifunctional DNA primase/polymerase [Arachnia sp.]